MKIGFIGLGKLGLPVATAIAYRGIQVLGYDVNPATMNNEPRSYKEAGPDKTGDFNTYFQDVYSSGDLTFASSMKEVAEACSLIFMCIQTPHLPEFEGITLQTGERSDFCYTYLINAVEEIVQYITQPTVLAVISTVLPGTVKTHIKPLLPEHVHLVYTPQTPAMGTAMYDFLHPEFYILGVDDLHAADVMEEFYGHITSVPVARMSVDSAELCKVVYNTYITMKISYAQTIMEIAERMNKEGSDISVDDITQTLQKATNRLVSPKYMTAGMQDGGGCHPRDLIALSYLSYVLNLSYDFFGELVKCRENQMIWLAEMCADHYDMMDGDFDNIEPMNPNIVILGTSFKKESNITTGSSALLVKNILEDWGYDVYTYDPYVDTDCVFHMDGPGVVLIGMNHNEFASYTFPERTIILDPFRYITDQEGVKVIRIGEPKK